MKILLRGAMIAAVVVLVFVATAVTSGAASDSIIVNGRPLHGEGSRKLAGCELTIGVTSLPEGSHSVRLLVTGAQPSGTSVVVDETAIDVVGSWSNGPIDMTGPIASAGLTKKSNGFHLRIGVEIDGASAGSALFWLACGAQQHSGHSWSVPLRAQWTDAGGHPVAPPVPIPHFVLTATSKQGKGTCVYPAGTSTLSCTYEKVSGHEGEDDEGDEDGPVTGVWVSGNGSYTVAAQGLPSGWSVRSGVGEFSPRVECAEPPVPPEDEVPKGRTDCPHTVVFRGPAIAPATTTTTSTTVAAQDVGASSTTTTVTAGAAGTQLPRTGSVSAPAALFAGGLVIVGSALAWAGRARGRLRRRIDLNTRREQ